MWKKTALLTLLFLIAATASPQSSYRKTSALTPNDQTLSLCDLFREPRANDGKELKLRAKYISTFEVSSFVDSDCVDKDKRAWAEFDQESVKASTKPDVLKRVEGQVYCCMLAGSSEIRETEMVITAVFHKACETGYGHNNEFPFMLTVKSVQEIGVTKVTKVPGFN